MKFNYTDQEIDGEAFLELTDADITRNVCTYNKSLLYKIYKFYKHTLSIVYMTTRTKIAVFLAFICHCLLLGVC